MTTPSKKITVSELLGRTPEAETTPMDDLPWDTDPSPVPVAVRQAPATLDAVMEERSSSRMKPSQILGDAPKKRGRISDMDLDQLYEYVHEKGKATPTVFARISSMEDFSTVQMRYCMSVCQAPCQKAPANVTLNNSQADIVILNFHRSMDGKFKTGRQEDSKYIEIWSHFMATVLPGVNWKVINLVKCSLDKFTKPSNLTVSKARPCSNYAIHEILAANPKVIFTTHTNDLKMLGFKDTTVKKNLGQVVWWENIPVMVSISVKVTTMIRQNATGTLWGADVYYLIRRDFEKLKVILNGQLRGVSPQEAIDELKMMGLFHVCSSLQEVRSITGELASLPEKAVISWDTETTSLDPWAPDARFLMHQFGITREDGIHTYVVPLWHRRNTAYDPNEAWPMVQDVLESPVTKVGHNAKFDMKYTRVTRGVSVVNVKFDTLLLLHAICSGLKGTYGLKKAVWDFLLDTGLAGYEDNLEFPDEDVLEDEEEDSSGENAETPASEQVDA